MPSVILSAAEGHRGAGQVSAALLGHREAHDTFRRLLVVGLSGRTGSGKTSAAALLASLGYTVVSTRDVLARVLEDRGQEVTREALRLLGGEVNRVEGQRWLFEQVVAPIGSTGRYAVDALRFPDDHDFLSERFGDRFLHLHVHASDELRRTRFVHRGGTNAEFERAQSHVTESMAPIMRRLAHRVILNNGDPEARDAALMSAINDGESRAPGCP